MYVEIFRGSLLSEGVTIVFMIDEEANVEYGISKHYIRIHRFNGRVFYFFAITQCILFFIKCYANIVINCFQKKY